MMARNPVASLVEALAGGAVEIIDLTQPLSERTPVIQLPEQFAQTPALKVHEVPPRHLIAPAVVIDKSAESTEDPDYLLTVEDIRAFEDEHGPLPDGGWLLLHTGWDARAHDAQAFLNAGSGQPQSPGFDAECARWLAEESPLVGVGVETVGVDAGAAGGFDPPFPVHYHLLGAGKYGVTQLANLASLPPTGALLVIAPLKLTGGTGSPIRAFALVARD